jgi:hypothetical protein
MILEIPDDRAILMDVATALYYASVQKRGMAARSALGLERHHDLREAEMTRRAQALETLRDAVLEAENVATQRWLDESRRGHHDEA